MAKTNMTGPGKVNLTLGIIDSDQLPAGGAATSVSAGNGTASAPTITFSADTNTGVYRVGADSLGITAAGTLVASFSAAGVGFTNGAAATPSINFAADTNTGLYRVGADELGFAANGVLQFSAVTAGLKVKDGAAATPSLCFTTSATTGLYQRAAGEIGIASAGTEQGAWTAAGLEVKAGAAATPSICFTGSLTTGFYRSAADSIGLSVAGVSHNTFSATNFIINNGSGTQNLFMRKQTAGTAIQVEAANCRAGFNVASGTEAQFKIAQDAAAANYPVLWLSQSDTDVAFINYVGTAGSGGSIDTRTTVGAATHQIKIKINGTDAWIAATTTTPS